MINILYCNVEIGHEIAIVSCAMYEYSSQEDSIVYKYLGGRRGCDHMAVGFTTT